jgi:hypothetical protein
VPRPIKMEGEVVDLAGPEPNMVQGRNASLPTPAYRQAGVGRRKSYIRNPKKLSLRAQKAWQSDEVVTRGKPVAISRVPSLCSGQGFVATAPRNDLSGVM